MVYIVIQARMSSTRLPGKTMMLLEGKEVLWHIIERCKQSKAEKIIVATSIDKSDDIIETKCNEWKIPCIRGNLNNVLSRYIDTSKQFPADAYVRITGDCPLIEAEIIDTVIDARKEKDYASNVLDRAIPHGLDVEVFSMEALQKASKEVNSDHYKEHVTLIMRKNPNKTFSTISVPMKKEYAHPELRLTLDTKEDLEIIKEVYKRFFEGKPFSVIEVIPWLIAHPEITSLNKEVHQKTLQE